MDCTYMGTMLRKQRTDVLYAHPDPANARAEQVRNAVVSPTAVLPSWQCGASAVEGWLRRQQRRVAVVSCEARGRAGCIPASSAAPPYIKSRRWRWSPTSSWT